MPPAVAVVTDSTAYLPADLADRYGVTTVPLHAAVGDVEGAEGSDLSPAAVANALVQRRGTVTTSRPAPAAFADVYEKLLASGAPGVVSVHLSAKLSGTCEAAALAAAEYGDQVRVVDARSTGMGLGFATLAAAAAAEAGGDVATVAAAAEACAARTTTLFYVDTLEHLRRGGRIGAASALLGTALSVKPILHVAGGAVVPRERVRTSSRALARLVDLAVEAAGDGIADVAVHHLAAPERAAEVAERIAERLGDRLGALYTSEVGAVVGAHVGPGLVGVVVCPRP